MPTKTPEQWQEKKKILLAGALEELYATQAALRRLNGIVNTGGGLKQGVSLVNKMKAHTNSLIKNYRRQLDRLEHRTDVVTYGDLPPLPMIEE